MFVCEHNSFWKHACNPKHLNIKWVSRPVGSVVIMWHSALCTTRIARHRSLIKLKFIRSVCLSCRTLAEQVTHNPRFYCILLRRWNWFGSSSLVLGTGIQWPPQRFLWILKDLIFSCYFCVVRAGFTEVSGWREERFKMLNELFFFSHGVIFKCTNEIPECLFSCTSPWSPVMVLTHRYLISFCLSVSLFLYLSLSLSLPLSVSLLTPYLLDWVLPPCSTLLLWGDQSLYVLGVL